MSQRTQRFFNGNLSARYWFGIATGNVGYIRYADNARRGAQNFKIENNIFRYSKIVEGNILGYDVIAAIKFILHPTEESIIVEHLHALGNFIRLKLRFFAEAANFSAKRSQSNLGFPVDSMLFGEESAFSVDNVRLPFFGDNSEFLKGGFS